MAMLKLDLKTETLDFSLYVVGNETHILAILATFGGWADAAASGGVRSKPLLAGELARPACNGETVGQAPGVSGTKRSESR
jgi:hypothetical protein